MLRQRVPDASKFYPATVSESILIWRHHRSLMSTTRYVIRSKRWRTSCQQEKTVPTSKSTVQSTLSCLYSRTTSFYPDFIFTVRMPNTAAIIENTKARCTTNNYDTGIEDRRYLLKTDIRTRCAQNVKRRGKVFKILRFFTWLCYNIQIIYS